MGCWRVTIRKISMSDRCRTHDCMPMPVLDHLGQEGLSGVVVRFDVDVIRAATGM